LERFGTDLARINIWLLFLFVTRILAGAHSRNLFSGAEESSAHRREHFGIQNPNGKNRNRCIIDTSTLHIKSTAEKGRNKTLRPRQHWRKFFLSICILN
jgi:hypothetical protein